MRKSNRALAAVSVTVCGLCSCAMSKSGLLDFPSRMTAPGARKLGRSAATVGTARDHAAALGTASTMLMPALRRYRSKLPKKKARSRATGPPIEPPN